MLLPDSMELRICVPFNSRSTAWASFDGRGRVELKRGCCVLIHIFIVMLTAMTFLSEGDHIKVTASRYPFPTVCADKQSTDWFHAISRTLKWNERERQKSFVVVEEEGPPKQHKRRSKRSGTISDTKIPDPRVVEESPADEEEDEVTDEEEEDKFDIDDSSPEAESNISITNGLTPAEKVLGQEKAATLRPHPPVIKRKSKSRSRSRPPPSHSGVDSPSRYANPAPHPPDVSSRHVGFDISSPRSSAPSSPDSLVSHVAQQGTRDDLHGPRQLSSRSRIPKDRELDLEAVKTPTASSLVYGRGRGHSRSRSTDQPEHRAFAVWGQDESDSNASDSES